MTEQQIDRKDLKIQALKESLAGAQDTLADYRVEITVLNANLQEALSENQRLAEENKSLKPEEDEIVDAVEVEEDAKTK